LTSDFKVYVYTSLDIQRRRAYRNP